MRGREAALAGGGARAAPTRMPRSAGCRLARKAAERDAAATRRRVGEVEAALEAMDEDS